MHVFVLPHRYRSSTPRLWFDNAPGSRNGSARQRVYNATVPVLDILPVTSSILLDPLPTSRLISFVLLVV